MSTSVVKPVVKPVATSPYSTYPLPKLLTLWKQGELTETQMVGHLLQHQLDQEQRILHLEKTLVATYRSVVEPVRT
jgi:hypothetical protein